MLITGEQRAKAQAFLSLHIKGELLILPNVWSPIAARVLESQG
jgi:2-methylisocitrate lyase-like PEP mutase family enzyme